MINDILSCYQNASQYERERGESWYQEVNAFCARLSARYHVPADRIAGMLAVLSPRISWRIACQTAVRMLSAYDAGEDVAGLRWPGLALNVEKAIGILYTGDIDRFLSGSKVEAFYDNITNPGSSSRVTVDVWAVRVIHGITSAAKNLDREQYGQYESAYRAAADRIGIPALQLQAITWLSIQRLAKYPAAQLTLF